MRPSSVVRRLNRLRHALAILGVMSSIAVLSACGGSVSTPPQRVAVSAAPNGIAVRASDGAIFITDDTTNSVLSSADGRNFAHYASVPAAAGQSNSLSQLTFATPNDLLIERFGFGTASAIYDITGPDTIAAFTGPDPARRRLGIASIGANRALSTWFIKSGQGGLSLITYDTAQHTATERDLIVGFGKPVGVVVSGDTVYVSDQANNAIVKASLAALLAAAQPVAPPAAFVQITGPDLMAIDANGTIYTKCSPTSLCAIAPGGTSSVLASDFQDPRGVAIDTARNRLYAIDRASGSGATSYLRSFALH